MKEFVALRKNSKPYERIRGHTKEFVSLRKNSQPYERIRDLTLSIRDRSRPGL